MTKRKMNNLNTYEIRQSLGEYFSNAVKRDVFEFLTALCTKYNYIKNMIGHQVTSTCRCNSCGNTKVITSNNVLLSIEIMKKKSFNINGLLNTHFRIDINRLTIRVNIVEEMMFFKNELNLTKDILIIHLKLFSLQNYISKDIT